MAPRQRSFLFNDMTQDLCPEGPEAQKVSLDMLMDLNLILRPMEATEDLEARRRTSSVVPEEEPAV